MRRFFMLIPEAVQLVLHAAALGEGGALYVLDMGEQIKLLDMARNLIRLSGFVPEEEIPITFTGPRPGEKLFEELVEAGETLEPSAIDKILKVRSNAVASTALVPAHIARLEQLAEEGDSAGVLKQLSLIVPVFRPAVEESPHLAAAASLEAFRPGPFAEPAAAGVIDRRPAANALAGRA
jgi:FlaA1/EpsC-like NDP-sugar epimerase